MIARSTPAKYEASSDVSPQLRPNSSITAMRSCEPAELRNGLMMATLREIDDNVLVAGAFGAATGADDARAFGAKLLDDRATDPTGRAGDDACFVAQAKIHGSLR